MPSYRLVGESLPRCAGASDVAVSNMSTVSGESVPQPRPQEPGDECADASANARSCTEVTVATGAPGESCVGPHGEYRTADEYLEARRKARSEAIDRLVAEARSQGHFASRTFWSMVYDFERAPRTTNRAQLAGLGIDVPKSDELADDEVTTQLWRIIEGLARLGAYLSHTNHLTDRELYQVLEERILDEDVPDIVGGEGMQEWIDLLSEGDFDKFDFTLGDGPPPPPMPSDRDERLPRPGPGEPESIE
jgi:hypothetical protein